MLESIKRNFSKIDLMAVTIIYWGCVLYGRVFWQNNISWQVESLRSFFSALASVTGSLFGFAVTGVTIISSLTGDPRLSRIAKNPRLEDLIGIFFSATRWLAFSTALSIGGMCVVIDHVRGPYVALVWYAATMSVVRLVWVVYFLSKVASGLVVKKEETPAQAPNETPPLVHPDFEKQAP